VPISSPREEEQQLFFVQREPLEPPQLFYLVYLLFDYVLDYANSVVDLHLESSHIGTSLRFDSGMHRLLLV
jgi:hypothetical protein